MAPIKKKHIMATQVRSEEIDEELENMAENGPSSLHTYNKKTIKRKKKKYQKLLLGAAVQKYPVKL